MIETKTLPPVRKTSIGFYILGVPYHSHPEFDFERAKHGMSEEVIQTDLLRNWSASSGLRVYPEFKYATHVASEPLDYDPDLPLSISFDWGLSPACIIAQLSAFGQLLVYPSLCPEEREYEGIYAFAQKVADHLFHEYALPHDRDLAELPLVVIGDPAGRAKTGHTHGGKRSREAVSCTEILFRGLVLDLGEDERGQRRSEKLPGWGWRVIPGEVSHARRQEAVRSRLKTLVHGEPAILFDPRAEFLHQVMQGGYRFQQYADGTYSREPEKNHFSHGANALEYLCTRVSARPPSRESDDDEPPSSLPFVSQANSSYRFG